MRIPLWVEASRLRVAVFGGGSVGARRARLFAEAGSQVVLIAREPSPEALASGADVVVADLRLFDVERVLRRVHIAVVAVNDADLADRLAEAAVRAGALLNDATRADRADVVVPYRRSIAGLDIAVTSGGAAGAAARLALDVVERCIEASHIPALLSAYARAKSEAKRLIGDVRARLRFYDALIRDGEFMQHVARGDVESAVDRALRLLREYVGGA